MDGLVKEKTIEAGGPDGKLAVRVIEVMLL